jgi:hypothetical protein
MDFSRREPLSQQQDDAISLPLIAISLFPHETLYAPALGAV